MFENQSLRIVSPLICLVQAGSGIAVARNLKVTVNDESGDFGGETVTDSFYALEVPASNERVQDHLRKLFLTTFQLPPVFGSPASPVINRFLRAVRSESRPELKQSSACR